MTPTAQLHAALQLTVNKRGHLDSCGHRTWINGFTNQPGQRHDCDLPGCDGEGSPCTARCKTVRTALRLPLAAPSPEAPRLPVDVGVSG